MGGNRCHRCLDDPGDIHSEADDLLARQGEACQGAHSSVRHPCFLSCGRQLLIYFSATTPIVKALQSPKIQVENGEMNPMCWTDNLLRIYHLETISTHNHPSAEINAMKYQWTINFVIPLLQSCASTRSAKAKALRLPWDVTELLSIEAAKINELVEMMKKDQDPKVGEIEVLMTRIVARKAKIFPQNGPWLSEWHGTEADPES